ncbi:Protein serine/threonine phosphatase PrpC, regulation of stationary phase [hydrothermal vent metagenome]|uniref:Protein serine/threonine phosphatase PrpC, regulation of stationary phase n=1 Tax=hydrothermal vent metagenome TaxID=652676 RepID=A0A3B1ATZ6_9ZZZZ
MQYTITTTNQQGDRKYNQDRVTVLETDNCILLVLADGIGGKKGGDLAAQTLVDTVTNIFETSSTPIEDPKRYLTNILRVAHNAVTTMGKNHQPIIEPGTTAVLCLIQQDNAYWAHVGDSRFYLFREGLSLYRTKDHSYVEELYQRGKISLDKRQGHPMRGYITQCIGHMQVMPTIDVSDEVALLKGDILLLCTDGLWEPLDDAVIGEILSGMELERALSKLTEQALQASSPHADNTSAIAIRINSLTQGMHPKKEEQEKQHEAKEKVHELDLAIRNIEDVLEEYKHEID